MAESPDQQSEVSIIDKNESADKAVHVVDGFVIEDSKEPFPQNGHLSFVPEDYGKEQPPPPKKTRTQTGTPTVPKAPPPPAEDLPPGMLKCEFCAVVDERDRFLPPSRRFCSLTCCKRYSAEKRYYPYGRDEEGIAQSIREGLLNPRSRSLRPGASKSAQNIRDQRRRKMAYYSQDSLDSPTALKKTPRGKRGRRGRPHSTSPSQSSRGDKLSTSIIEPYAHPTGLPLSSWTIEDVGEFLTYLGYEAYIDKFVDHEIDGKALALVRDHHLLMTMKLRLGPTLKICEHVHAIKALDEGAEEV